MTDKQILALSAQCGTINDFGKTFFTDDELLEFASLLREKFIAELGEPVAWIIDHIPNAGQRQLVGSKLYADNEMKKGEESNSGFGKRYPYDVCTPLYALPKDKDELK